MHRELPRSGRAGWLRAAVLGADDGIVSTASLVIGVAAAAASRNAVLLAGVTGLVAGLELRGFEPLTPCMPLMRGCFTSPRSTHVPTQPHS